eukprot:TRINITY_DN1604_c0_g1_i1.p1 TRINITY_DN1604_c0_g1~~TRINITY_DN1604_c0_g1_i1.p1  ORF type:complete len:310 (-),score=52.67 TRINITY_DN1604_c0_g1_i1:222-1151(-)
MIPDMRYLTPTHMDVARLYPYDSTWRDQKQFRSKNETLAELLHLWPEPNPLQFRTGGIRMEFCCTTISEDQVNRANYLLHWPDGHLCVYAHGAIPSTDYKFQQGSVGWDCENGNEANPKLYGNQIYLDPGNEFLKHYEETATQERLSEALPTGLYFIQYDGRSEQYFAQNILCMKRDRRPESEIELPRDVPFYLMQFQGTCQKVIGMYFTPVELKWTTEKDHKMVWAETGLYDKMFVELLMNSWGRALAYGRRDTIPDGHYGQDYISIKYCFYQKIVKREPTLNYDAISMNNRGVYNIRYSVTENPLCP